MSREVLRLPVSGLAVTLRQLAGAEDILLLEATAFDTSLALALLYGIAQSANGERVEWDMLSVTDLDAMLLLTRQAIFGDSIRADAACPAWGCGAPIEVSFRVSEYLAHHKPRKVRGVEPKEETGWFRFRDVPVEFRLPSGADRVAIAPHSHPEGELIRRCVRPADLSAKVLKRVEKAMEAIAPSLSNNLQGKCAECGAVVEIFFDPQQFTLRELRHQAVFIYEDIHLLAMYYQWSEAEILALPRQRRIHYAEMIRQARRSA